MKATPGDANSESPTVKAVRDVRDRLWEQAGRNMDTFARQSHAFADQLRARGVRVISVGELGAAQARKSA